MNTLLIDNNPLVLKLVTEILETRGHTVLTAADGIEALRIVENHVPDLIFCDLVMPNISGDKLCRKFRSMEALKTTPIVVLSAIAAEDDIDVREFGANACIAKGPYKLMKKHVVALIEEFERDNMAALPEETLGLEEVHLRGISKELLSAKKHSDSILGNLAEGIVELVSGDRVIYANQAACDILNLTEEDVLASHFIDIFEHHQRSHVNELLRECSETMISKTGKNPLFVNGRQIAMRLVRIVEEDSASSVVILDDITDFKRTEKELRIHADQQKVVADLGRKALTCSNLDVFISEIVTKVTTILEVDFFAVFELLPNRENILLRDGVGWKSGLIGKATLPIGVESQAAYTLRLEEPVLVPDLTIESRFSQSAFLQAHNVISGVSVIIGGPEFSWGVLGAYAVQRNAFSGNDVHFLEAVANLLADAIHASTAIENRLELEKQVRVAQKLESLGLLAGGIAHDFNNLLMGILGNAEIALLDLPSDSPIKERIQHIEFAGNQAAHLCKQMLAYAGKSQLAVQAVDISNVVHKMVELLKVSISKKAVLDLQLGSDLPCAEADENQISQVIMNLIMNASDAIVEDEGTISVRTGALEWDRHDIKDLSRGQPEFDLEPGSYVFLQVSDTGCGMSRETQQNIFEPFFSTKPHGHGLGLSAVQGIVRAHKGAIKIYSSAERGTTIKVFLPSCDRIVDEVEPVDVTRGIEGVGTILVVDDELIVRRIAKTMLERMSFDVVTASGGHQALQCIEENRDKIVLILMDLTMPEMDGVETARRISRLGITAPIVFSSGHKQQMALMRVKEGEFSGFIQKPYGYEPLRSTVFRLLDK